MIRTVRIPLRGRLGLVQIGDGGSASDYIFDPATGLSNDPQLSYPLQNLTPAQLQTALTNPSGVTADLAAVTSSLSSGASLPCGTGASGDPNCTGGIPQSTFAGLSGTIAGVPSWIWIFGAATVAAGLLIGKSR